MIRTKTADFVAAKYTTAPISSIGGGLPNSSNLINTSRIFGALNPASLAHAITGVSNGSAPIRDAIRESVRAFISVVENAQLDNAMQNMGYGSVQAMTATAPTPVAPNLVFSTHITDTPDTLTAPPIAQMRQIRQQLQQKLENGTLTALGSTKLQNYDRIFTNLAVRRIYDDAIAQIYINADYQAHRGSARAQEYFGNVDQLADYLYQNNWTIIQFEQRLHVIDLAVASSCAYDRNCGGTGLSGSSSLHYSAVEPAKFGLTTKDFEMGNGFRAVLLQGGDKYVLAFAGTNFTSLPDWQNNIQQAFGLQSAQYDAAVKLANDLSARIGLGNLELTGHSLGGGLATVAAGVTGRVATTFASAPISNGALVR